MTDNPYESPAWVAIDPRDDLPRSRMPRPVGVSILAVLHLIGGGLLLFVQFMLLANLQAVEGTLRSVGIPPVLLVLGVMFLAVLTLASGVGMWIGTRWGWWCGAFYYVYAVFRNGAALLTIAAMADQIPATDRGIEYYVIKHVGRIIVHSLLFLYFFKGNVLEYFDLETLSRAKSVAILVGVCIALTAATSAIGFLLQ